MPEIYRNIYIGLEDYFSKFGFDDGNEEGIGWNNRDLAIRILNKHLKVFKIKADEIDVSSGHNNCQIAFYKEDKEIEIGYSNSDDVFSAEAWEEALGEPRKPAEQLSATRRRTFNIATAVEAASKEFDNEVLDDLSRVLQTPNKDLPLLVGKLKDEDAKKLYERLLKGAT